MVVEDRSVDRDELVAHRKGKEVFALTEADAERVALVRNNAAQIFAAQKANHMQVAGCRPYSLEL